MKSTEFSNEELVPYIGLFIVIISLLYYNFKKGYQFVWSPLSIICIIFSYYCLLGPYQAVVNGNSFDRLVNMRQFYASSFWGALIFILSTILGFFVNQSKKIIPHPHSYPISWLSYYGKRLFILGFGLFTISTGGQIGNLINPLDAEAVEQFGGGLANYLGLSLNFLIPGVTLLFIYYLKTKNGFLWFIVTFFLAVALFISIGFRYRLVLLICSMGISYYLLMRKRPNLLFLIPAIAFFIAFMGFINLTRRYGGGLDTSRLKNENSGTFYGSGLQEALIFQTSGAVIDFVPQKHPHVGFQPLLSTLIFPIPKVIYPEKNSFKYLKDTLDKIYGKGHSSGAAMLSYGEYYLAFGWIGIIFGGFLIGWIYKKLWLWYQLNWSNPFLVVVYAVTVSYLYVILSRGYLPQVTMLFFFTVFPAYFVLRLARKKYFLLNRKISTKERIHAP